MISLIKYSSVDITNGKKQDIHLLNNCIAEAESLAFGAVGGDLVTLT